MRHIVQIQKCIIDVTLCACSRDLTVQGFLLLCWPVLWRWGALWVRRLEGPPLSGLRWLRSASEHCLNWWPLEPVHHQGQKSVAALKRQAGPTVWGA